MVAGLQFRRVTGRRFCKDYVFRPMSSASTALGVVPGPGAILALHGDGTGLH